jgi:hypothetical protein
MDWLTAPSVRRTTEGLPLRVPRVTKLYISLLILSVYTHFTFAQEAYVHSKDWAYRLHNSPPNEKRTAEQDPEDEYYIAPLKFKDGIKHDDFESDGNSTRTYVLACLRHD